MAEVGEITETTNLSRMEMRLGGCGGVYFQAAGGELKIHFMKMDILDAKQEMRLVLIAPDRQVLADFWIHGTGASGKVMQQVDISYQVEYPGIYGLFITSSNDRYGERAYWGFTTNCPKYLIETSRGHKDARHQEPLVLGNPEQQLSITYMPAKDVNTINITGTRETAMVKVFDGDYSELAREKTDENGNVELKVKNEFNVVPWHIELPAMSGTVEADGLTRWFLNSIYGHASLWTDNPDSWFDFYTNRKLLTPYSVKVHIPENGKQDIKFTVHSEGGAVKNVQLSLEFPEGTEPFTSLSQEEIEVKPGEFKDVILACKPSSEIQECRLRATCGNFTTYSTVTVLPGEKEQDYAFDIPLELTPYCHENERFAYYPNYPVFLEPYFDMKNRPFMISGNKIMSFRNGQWTGADIPTNDNLTWKFNNTKIAFDNDNWVYVLITKKDNSNWLAYSSDEGVSFKTVQIPFKGECDIEQFTGHNTLAHPPVVAVHWQNQERDPKYFWRVVNDFYLVVTKKVGKDIVIDKHLKVTDKSIGIAALHSGIPGTIVSYGNKTHLIWAEVSDPEDKSIEGVPTFAATYDYGTQTLSNPALIGFGPPANDIHNTPCITIDSMGFLHAMIGTHGSSFRYARSLASNSTSKGWTESRSVGSKLSQTYIGMICDKNDRLHMVFRLWRDARPDFPEGFMAGMAIMSKDALADEWDEPRYILRSPLTDYSVFYHKFGIDRTNKFYLSYDYYTTYWFYRNDQMGSRRCLIMSPDGGISWQMAPDWK